MLFLESEQEVKVGLRQYCISISSQEEVFRYACQTDMTHIPAAPSMYCSSLILGLCQVNLCCMSAAVKLQSRAYAGIAMAGRL